MKKNKKMIRIDRFFWIGMAAALLAAPNGTLIKNVINQGYSVDVLNLFRYIFLILVFTPLAIKSLKLKPINRKALRYMILGSLSFCVAVITYTYSFKYTQASNISIMTLASPLVLIFLSVKINHEKLQRKAMAGVSLAVLGAFLVVYLPIATQQRAEFSIHPIAALLVGINCVAYPLMTIFARKANEAGASMSVVAWFLGIGILIYEIIFIILGNHTDAVVDSLKPLPLLTALYSGLVVSGVVKVMNVLSYEHIGAQVMSIISYMETLLSIGLPILILGEKLSLGIVFGGALILMGVYLAEHHKYKHHRHFHIMRHH